ncbi:hypothetical protein BLS_004394 [Venturia inaequalis]|uniref:Uncharacterized protein n=1 Tax=Venturia inaequalis TaxID=5025 RepID=A0A8H3YSC1_VENIN|nr:hypothetical protein BLS_004394 [Venturia inaequalis]
MRERRHAELIDALLAALSAPDEPSSPGVTVQLAKRSNTTTIPPKSTHIQIITITAPTPMSTTTLTVEPTPSVASFSFNTRAPTSGSPDIQIVTITAPTPISTTTLTVDSTPSVASFPFNTRAPTNGTGENTSTIIETVADISTVTVTAKSSSSTESVGTITPTPMTTSTPSNSTHPFEPMTIIPVPPSAGQVERPEHSPEKSKDEEKKKKKKKKSKELGLAIGLPLSGAAASVAAAAWVATNPGPKMLRVSSNMARAGTEMIHRTNQLVKGVKTGIEKSLKLTEKFGRAAEAAMNEFAIDGSFGVDFMLYMAQTASREAGLEMGDSAANVVSKANEVASDIVTWIKNWIINILRGKGIGHRLREWRLKENDLIRLKEYEKYPSVQEHPTTEPHQPGTVEDWLWYKIKESIFHPRPEVRGNGYYRPASPPMGLRMQAYELAQTYETKLAERIEEIDRFHFDDTVRNDHWDRDREENYDSQDDEEYSYPEDDSQAPNDPEEYGNEAVEWEIPFAEWMRDPERNQKPWKDRLRDYKRQFGDPGPNASQPTPPNAPNGPSSINAPSGQESRPQPTEPPHTTDATQFNAPVGGKTKTGGSEVLYLGHYAAPDDSDAENTDDS